MIKKEFEELIKKYKIDTKKLDDEQNKLAKLVSLKNKISKVQLVGGVDVINTGNKIISVFILVNKDFEIIEQKIEVEKARFPYIPGYYAYRVLPSILKLWKRLENRPDIVFVKAHGISHPRGFGLASHFGVLAEVPTIGIASTILFGELKGEELFIKGKKVAQTLVMKKGANPIFVSLGYLISLKKALEITKQFFKEGHKMPEPIYLAHKFGIRMKKEIKE